MPLRLKPLGHPALHAGQRRVQTSGLCATGHGHVGLATTLAAHLLRHKIHQLTGFDTAHGVSGHASSDLHLVAIDTGQLLHRGFEFVFELVLCLAQGLGVSARQACGQELDAFQFHRLPAQFIALR